MSGKQVLLHGFGAEEETACSLIRQAGAEPITVQDAQLDETIGYLCGVTGRRKHHGDSSAEVGPVMVFHNFPQKELDELLAALRTSGLKTKSLKAVVTPTNESWTLRDLFRQIQEEQQVMGALMQLKKLRDSIPMPSPDKMELMMALMQAEKLLSGTEEVSLQEVEQSYRTLLRLTGK